MAPVPTAETPAPPAPAPAFAPPVTADHLPPSLRSLALGVTTMSEVEALFPPAPGRTVTATLDSTMGGDRDLVTADGPNAGLRYSELRVAVDETVAASPARLGEDYRWAKFRFARLAGRDAPVLFDIGVAQLGSGSPPVCSAAAPLARAPAALQGCPAGFEPRLGADASHFMICAGSADGQRPITITCMGHLLVYELLVPRDPAAPAAPAAPPAAE